MTELQGDDVTKTRNVSLCKCFQQADALKCCTQHGRKTSVCTPFSPYLNNWLVGVVFDLVGVQLVCICVCACVHQVKRVQGLKPQSNPCQSLCSESYSSSTPMQRTPSSSMGVPWWRSRWVTERDREIENNNSKIYYYIQLMLLLFLYIGTNIFITYK